MDLRYAKRGKEMLSYGSQWRSGLRLGLGFNCLSLFSRLGFQFQWWLVWRAVEP